MIFVGSIHRVFSEPLFYTQHPAALGVVKKYLRGKASTTNNSISSHLLGPHKVLLIILNTLWVLTHNPHKNPWGRCSSMSPNQRWRNSSTEGSHMLPKVTSVSREFPFCCDLWPLKTFELVHVICLGMSEVEGLCVCWKTWAQQALKRALEMRFE